MSSAITQHYRMYKNWGIGKTAAWSREKHTFWKYGFCFLTNSISFHNTNTHRKMQAHSIDISLEIYNMKRKFNFMVYCSLLTEFLQIAIVCNLERSCVYLFTMWQRDFICHTLTLPWYLPILHLWCNCTEAS